MAKLQFGAALKQAHWGRIANVRGAGEVMESRPIRMNGVAAISGGGVMGLPVAVKGNWEDERTFVLEYDEIANTNTYRLRLAFDGDGVRVQAKERTWLFDETYSGVARKSK